MKTILFALSAVVLSASFVSASTMRRSFDIKSSAVLKLDDKKIKIKAADLPDAVKTTLRGQDYAGWQISSVYKFSESGNFEIQLKNADEVKTVKFDKEGNILQ